MNTIIDAATKDNPITMNLISSKKKKAIKKTKRKVKLKPRPKPNFPPKLIIPKDVTFRETFGSDHLKLLTEPPDYYPIAELPFEDEEEGDSAQRPRRRRLRASRGRGGVGEGPSNPE